MKARVTEPLLVPSAYRAGCVAGAHAPFIPVTIAGREFSALLDTGASASLFGEQVLSHLQKHAVRLRDCRTTFNLAKGVAHSAGAARLTVRWGERMRRTRFVHLPGLSVPVILGRDFLLKTGIVVDIANGGYRDGQFTSLKPFISPPASDLACADGASESCRAPSSGASPRASRSPAHGPLWDREARHEPCRAQNSGASPCAMRLSTHNPQWDRATRHEEAPHPLSACAAHLDDAQKARLSALLRDNADLFTDQPGCTDLASHAIETGDALPLKCNPRPVSLAKRQVIDGLLDEMLSADIIRRSYSAWASPIVLVPKKDGSHRLCVDYRRLNGVTRKDAYPLPTISSIVGTLGSARYFTTLDASKGYLQVRMDARDRSKTAFTSHRGLFEFTRMPFGLCNGPATFQRLMDRVLGEAKWSYCMCYLDDIVIYSRTFEEHLAHVADVLERVRAAGMTLNPAKAQLAQTRVQLLGFTLGEGSIEPDREKLRAILDFPAPKDVRGLRRFLGMANFYRSFIPSCARVQAPLSKLLGKSAEWQWGPEQQQAFRQLSSAIAETAQLRLPDLTRPFVVQTDASDLGLGAVLLQEYDGVLQPLAFASRSLIPAERNYSVTEKECLAIVFALRKFDVYLDGTKFVVQTDHSALSWLMRLREPAGRLARWALLIQHYDFSVQYRKGSTNVVADALSRAPLSTQSFSPGATAAAGALAPASVGGETSGERGESASGQTCFSALQASSAPESVRAGELLESEPMTPMAAVLSGDETNLPFGRIGIAFSRQELLKAQQIDPFCRGVSDGLRETERRDAAGSAAGAGGPETACVAESPADLYLLDHDGLLLKYIATDDDAVDPFKVVIPKSLRSALLRCSHDEPLAGHLSGSKVFAKLSQTVTWPGIKRDIFRYCRSCHVCQMVKSRGGKPPGLMKPIDSERPWQVATCDLMGPFPRSKQGFTHLMVVVDHFSKWVELFPLRKVTARAVLERLQEVFCRFGFPKRLITDNASYFTARVFGATCRSLGINHCTTSPYHPQSNLTERLNRTLKPMLAAFAERQKDWADHLSELAFAVRTSENRSTGFSPAFLNFGRELANPVTSVMQCQLGDEEAPADCSAYASALRDRLCRALCRARQSLASARAQQKAQYDRKHRHLSFKVGDLVLKRNHALSDATKGFSASLAPKWLGPYRVEKVWSPLAYLLKDPPSGKLSRAHIADLKAFASRSDELAPVPSGIARKQRGTPGATDRIRTTHRYNLRKRSPV